MPPSRLGLGDDFSKDQLAEQTSMVDYGYSDLIPNTYDGDFGYIAKNATHNEASLTQHIRLNSRELIHGRGFFRDGKTGQPYEPAGRSKAGMRLASRDAAADAATDPSPKERRVIGEELPCAA